VSQIAPERVSVKFCLNDPKENSTNETRACGRQEKANRQRILLEVGTAIFAGWPHKCIKRKPEKQ
jgi:hypothetical protein